MTMYHNCGTPVIIDLNKSFDFYSFFNQEGKILRVTTMFIKTRNIIPVYFCQECKVDVDTKDLRLECSNCHEILPVSFVLMSPYDSIICKKCVQEYLVENCKPYKLPTYQPDNE